MKIEKRNKQEEIKYIGSSCFFFVVGYSRPFNSVYCISNVLATL